MIERKRPGEALDKPGHREQRRRSAVRRAFINMVHDRSIARGSIREMAQGELGLFWVSNQVLRALSISQRRQHNPESDQGKILLRLRLGFGFRPSEGIS